MKRLTISALLFGTILYTPQAFAQAKCNQGYVWREATSNDYVCVTPQTRQQAWDDNAQQDARRAGSGPYGYETCKQGYVWREATENDKVCVTPATRNQAHYDNSQAGQRVQGSPTPSQLSSFEQGRNRPGGDFSNILSGGPSECSRFCEEDAECRAWTYVEPGIQGPSGRCWLKRTVPQAVGDTCCTSGVMRR